MTRTLAKLLISIILLAHCDEPHSQDHLLVLVGTVIKIVDGDTIDVQPSSAVRTPTAASAQNT